MSAADVLFSPVVRWREACADIIQWVEKHRRNDQKIYALDRYRPTGALYLREFLEAYWEYGQRFFWRLDNPSSLEYELHKFEFDGIITPAHGDLPYPAYGEAGWDYYRSIQDVNLVPNTYTSYFIFGNERDANSGLTFVQNQFP